jgi:hypothetical protein
MVKPKVNKNKKDDTDKTAAAINYPDARYEKTGAACPDDAHVKEAKNWTEEHQQ